MRAARIATGLLVGAAALAALAACGSEARVSEASASRGQQLFVEKCGACHTLAAAGTSATIGPNLDEAIDDVREQGFAESTIANVVKGQILYPVEEPPTGAPGMPANLVTGRDADSVALYVASTAGTGEQAAPPPATGADATGKDIFASAGCGSCHTLADADTAGTIGPNLDQSKPSLELAIDRVTNGSGAMPSFKDRLSEEQIRKVAEYVVDATK